MTTTNLPPQVLLVRVLWALIFDMCLNVPGKRFIETKSKIKLIN
jgi:hypothetical protein